jgi:mRNA interferase RelE/StbE
MLRPVAYAVHLKRSAAKQVEKLPEKDRLRVLSALAGLQEDPRRGTKLQGQLAGLYSLRVWPYRIIYEISQEQITVTVVTVGHRKSVYQG